MKHTITVTLSESAQRAALLAGEPAARIQTYEVGAELLPRLLGLPWAKVSQEGEASCEVPIHLRYSELVVDAPVGSPVDASRPSWGSYGCYSDGWTLTRPADGAAAISHAESFLSAFCAHVDATRAQRATERAERERRERASAAEWAALPLEWRALADGVGYCVPGDAPVDYRGPLDTTGASRYDRGVLERYAPEAYAEAEHEVTRLLAERTRADERRRESERAQLRDVISERSTEAFERFDAGVLPEDALSEVVSAHLFAPLAAFRPYEEITEQEVAHESECDVDDVRFATSDHDGPLEADEWATLKQIRAAAPAAAKVAVRLHRGYAGHEDLCGAHEIQRKSIRVTIEFAGRQWRREFDLGQEHAL